MKKWDDIWYSVAKFIGKVLVFFGPKITISGQLPESGPLVIFCNHASYLDPPILAILLNRRVWFLAKPEILEWFFVGQFVKMSRWVIPIDPEHPFGLLGAAHLLKQKKAIVIFPEGTRGNGQLQDFKNGVSTLARYGKLVPVAIKGTAESMPKGKLLPKRTNIKVIVGKPINIPPSRQRTDIIKMAEQEIAALLDQTV